MAEHGFPLTTNMARGFAWVVSLRSDTHGCFNEETGPGGGISVLRHHELTLCTADNLERSRANALTTDVVDNYFGCLKNTLEQNGVVNAPRQLFNCDETFLPLNTSCEQVTQEKHPVLAEFAGLPCMRSIR